MGWVNAGLASGRGERTICNWDEDSLTLAVEAAREALPSGVDRSRIGSHVLHNFDVLPLVDAGFQQKEHPGRELCKPPCLATALLLAGWR